MPPPIPKPRRQLKVHPTNEQYLESAVQSLERIAEGLTNILDALNALVVEDGDGVKALRCEPVKHEHERWVEP